MTFDIKRSEKLSRGELLLRSFFGWLYIGLPHGFLLFFVGLWGAILSFVSFWIILFTGRYPQSFFEFQVGLLRWQTRVQARQFNLVDGYPAFGVNGSDDNTVIDIPYPEKFSRGTLLLKFFFGWLYVVLPHALALFFVSIAVMFAAFIGWWAILFTGQLPEGIHKFITGFLRWNMRVGIYMQNMTDDYPPFSLS